MDGRLFTNSLLYCEGRERTHFRGWFHFFMCISFFPMLFTNYIYAFYNSDKTDNPDNPDKTNVISFIACLISN